MGKQRRKDAMTNEKELRKTFKEYKQYYLKGMNWKTQETFKEWFKRLDQELFTTIIEEEFKECSIFHSKFAFSSDIRYSSIFKIVGSE
jgi:hypothetical protein